MAISIKVNIEGQSLVQLTQTMKSLRSEQQALTSEGTSAYKEFEDQINEVNAALVAQIGDYDTANKSVATLKQEFKALKDLQSQAGSSEEMVKFASAAGQANDKMKDVNEQAAIFSGGTAFEQAGTAIGQVGDSIMSLDFEGAAEKAKSLTEITSKMSFSGATAGLKSLGTTFVQLGKSLLTNPIFVLAVVIVAIGAAVMALLNKFGLLKPILDGIKKAIGFITDAFSALTDAIGITNNAEEAAAKKQEEQHKEQKKRTEEKIKLNDSLYGMSKDLSDEEFQRLQEESGWELLRLEDVNELKARSAQEEKARGEEALNNFKTRVGDVNDLTEEEQTKYNELTDAVRENEQAVIIAETEKAKAKISRAIEADNLLAMLNAKAIKSESGRSKALLDIAEKEAIGKLEAKRREANLAGDLETAKKYEEAITLTKADFAKQRAAITTTVAKKETEERKTNNDNAQSDLEKRLKEQLDTIKKSNQSKLNDLKEGSQEYLTEQLAGLDRELAFIKKNTKGLKQDQLDLKLFTDDINKQKEKLNTDYNTRIQTENNKSALKAAELAVQEAKTDEERFAARLAVIQANKTIELQAVQKGSDEEKLIIAKAANEIKEIDLEKTAVIIQNQVSVLNQSKAAADLEASKAAFELERFKGQQKDKIAAIQEYGKVLIAQLTAQKVVEDKAVQDELDALEKIKTEKGSLSETELNKVKELEAQKKAIEESYRQAKIVAEEQTQLTIDELKKASIDKTLEDAGKMAAGAAEALSMITSISQSNLATQENQMNARHAQELSNLEEGSEAYEAAKKRQLAEEEAFAKKKFEIDKKQQIAAAVIQGIQAVLSAFSSGSAIPVVGAVTGPAFAALAAIAAAKNIQAIKSTTFQGGGGAPVAPSGGGDISGAVGGAGGGTDSAVPSFNLFGQGNNANTTNASSNVMGGNQGAMVVKAIVVESDITNSQANVARYKESATL